MIECGNSTKNDAPAHVIDTYELAFEDVFKGQTQVDDTKWSSHLPWGPDVTINDEEQYYVDQLGTYPNPISPPPVGLNEPFSFDENGLLITAEPITGDKPVTSNGDPEGQCYTSGVLTTRDSLCFTGGYFEVCMKPPCGADGSWPAAWLLNCMYYNDADQKNNAENGGVGNDKFNPEMDFEWVTGGNNPGTACTKMAYHYFTGSRADEGVPGGNFNLWDLDDFTFREVDLANGGVTNFAGIYEDCAGNFQSSLPEYCEFDACLDFHTYGIDWCPNDYIHYYIDGQIVRCINGDDGIISDQSMYFIMNLAVGGSFPFGGLPGGTANNEADPTTYPASVAVEYVRIYTKP